MADETSVERIHRVAQQIVADATSGPIASAPSPAEVAELLRKMEWHAADEIDAPRCVVCGGQSPSDVGTGHTTNCELAAMLRRCDGM